MTLQAVVPGHNAGTLAIGAVGQHADLRWKTLATAAVIRLSMQGGGHAGFTTDDVWAQLEPQGVTTHENRARGAVMKTRQACGLIAPAQEWRGSARAANHGRPVRVWRGQVAA